MNVTARRSRLENIDDLAEAAQRMGWRTDDLAYMGGIVGLAYLDRADGSKITVSTLDAVLSVDDWCNYMLDASLRERATA